MSSRSLVHELLFKALLEMRQRGAETGDNVVFHLADLFHNVALQLEQVESPDDAAEYGHILNFLKTRAKEKGCEEWLDRQLELLESKAAAGR